MNSARTLHYITCLLRASPFGIPHSLQASKYEYEKNSLQPARENCFALCEPVSFLQLNHNRFSFCFVFVVLRFLRYLSGCAAPPRVFCFTLGGEWRAPHSSHFHAGQFRAVNRRWIATQPTSTVDIEILARRAFLICTLPSRWLFNGRAHAIFVQYGRHASLPA